MLKQLERSLREIKRIKFLLQRSAPRQNLEIYFCLKKSKNSKRKIGENLGSFCYALRKAKNILWAARFAIALTTKFSWLQLFAFGFNFEAGKRKKVQNAKRLRQSWFCRAKIYRFINRENMKLSRRKFQLVCGWTVYFFNFACSIVANKFRV